MTQRLPIASAVYIVATGDCGGGAVQKKKKRPRKRVIEHLRTSW